MPNNVPAHLNMPSSLNHVVWFFTRFLDAVAMSSISCCSSCSLAEPLSNAACSNAAPGASSAGGTSQALLPLHFEGLLQTAGMGCPAGDAAGDLKTTKEHAAWWPAWTGKELLGAAASVARLQCLGSAV